MRQLRAHQRQRLRRSRHEIVDHCLRRAPISRDDAVSRAELQPVPAQDVLHLPVSVLGPHCHGQLGLVRRDLRWAFAQHRIRRQHVVQRRELIAPPGPDEEAEVLRMAVGGAQHPEQHLRLEEDPPVLLPCQRAFQQVEDRVDAGPAIGLVLGRWRQALGLAHVFLGQTHQALVPLRRHPPGAVESFDGQHLHVVEHKRLAGGDGQPVGGQDLGTQPLVLDRVAHVELHASDQAERQLEDVGGGRCAVRQVPPAIHLEQRRLLLGAGDRDAQVSVFARESQHLWCGGGTQERRHLGLGHRVRLHWCHAGRRGADRQDL